MHSGNKRVIKSGAFRNWIYAKTQWLATLLQVKMSNVSLAGQKWMLLVFCAIAIGLNVGFSYCSLVKPGETVMTVTPIRVIPLRQPVQLLPLISKDEYQRIHQWRLQLDSIKGLASQVDKISAHDKVWTLRDTLLYLEGVYHQQFK